MLCLWWHAFRCLFLEERLVIDVFLGAGVIYAILWAPLGMFGAWFLCAVLAGALIVMALNFLRGGLHRAISSTWARMKRTFNLTHCLSLAGIAVLSIAMLVLEVTVALSQPAGNTLDGANATLSTSLLITQGHFITSLSPYANYPLFQPQGMTTWFAASHVLLGLPLYASANETAPILLALSIPAAAAVGRRWLGGEVAPVVFAASLALLVSWPRMLVQGTYDFVASVPLALILLPWVAYLLMDKGPEAKVSALPVVCLVSLLCASYSPVPVEAIATGLIIGAVLLFLASPRRVLLGVKRLCQGLVVPLISLVGVLPTVWLLLTHQGALSGAGTTGKGTALVAGDLPTMLDPFLLNTSWVSPYLSLHIEFLVLLLAGVGLLLFGSKLLKGDEMRMAPAILLPSLAGAVFILVMMSVSGAGSPVFYLTNASELAIFFVLVEGLLVALPVAYALGWVLQGNLNRVWDRPDAHDQVPVHMRKGSTTWLSGNIFATVAAIALAFACFVYPVATTASDLTSHLDSELSEVSSVTPADIDAMENLSSLPGGPVLVAPGSAGEFLPAFCNDPLVFPLVGIGGGMGFSAGYSNGSIIIPFSGPSTNATYLTVVQELVNGSVTSSFPSQLSILQVKYIIVTGSSTTLFPPFLPGPLLSDPSAFQLLYHSGDAYLFEYVMVLP